MQFWSLCFEIWVFKQKEIKNCLKKLFYSFKRIFTRIFSKKFNLFLKNSKYSDLRRKFTKSERIKFYNNKKKKNYAYNLQLIFDFYFRIDQKKEK